MTIMLTETEARQNLTNIGLRLWKLTYCRIERIKPLFGGSLAGWRVVVGGDTTSRKVLASALWEPVDNTAPFVPFVIDYWLASVSILGHRVLWWRRWAA